MEWTVRWSRWSSPHRQMTFAALCSEDSPAWASVAVKEHSAPLSFVPWAKVADVEEACPSAVRFRFPAPLADALVRGAGEEGAAAWSEAMRGGSAAFLERRALVCFSLAAAPSVLPQGLAEGDATAAAARRELKRCDVRGADDDFGLAWAAAHPGARGGTKSPRKRPGEPNDVSSREQVSGGSCRPQGGRVGIGGVPAHPPDVHGVLSWHWQQRPSEGL